MPVLWLIKGLGAGGAERLLVDSARFRDPALTTPQIAYLLGHKDALLAEFAEAGVPSRCLRAKASWDLRWLASLRRLCRSERFGLIHSHSPITTIGARIVLRTLPRSQRPRLVTTEHNVWGSHARATRLADTYTALADRGHAETHLAVSEAVRASMPTRLQATTRVIRYGVDVDEVRSAGGQRAAARQSLGLAPGDVLVGTVANLRATKGYPDLLTAARVVVHRSDRVRFVALGQGPLEQELRERVTQLGLGDRFRFLGYRSDAVQVMAAFDIFCLASHHEGLPIALMEALVLGIPVVATTVGGVAEIVTDGSEAILVPPAQPQALADALIALIGDPARREEMSVRARARGVALDVKRAIHDVEAVYRELLDR
jgi:glycosyltransferase involved in cell wall biosynthesis